MPTRIAAPGCSIATCRLFRASTPSPTSMPRRQNAPPIGSAMRSRAATGATSSTIPPSTSSTSSRPTTRMPRWRLPPSRPARPFIARSRWRSNWPTPRRWRRRRQASRRQDDARLQQRQDAGGDAGQAAHRATATSASRSVFAAGSIRASTTIRNCLTPGDARGSEAGSGCARRPRLATSISVAQYLLGDIDRVIADAQTIFATRPLPTGGAGYGAKATSDSPRAAVENDDQIQCLVRFRERRRRRDRGVAGLGRQGFWHRTGRCPAPRARSSWTASASTS